MRAYEGLTGKHTSVPIRKHHRAWPADNANMPCSTMAWLRGGDSWSNACAYLGIIYACGASTDDRSTDPVPVARASGRGGNLTKESL